MWLGLGWRALRILFTPKLVTVLREGYGLDSFRADIVSGLTVAIVALPLSMAIAIASGVTPDRGLYTAIVGGFFVSLLGGSRFQVGGPAGAFIVLVAAGRAAARRRRRCPRHPDGRCNSGRCRPAATRHLCQVHPLSRDRGIHRRHRRDHSREPDQGSVRSLAAWCGAGRAVAQARGARERARHHQAAGAAAGDADHWADRRAADPAAGLAGHPDRRRCRNRDGVGAGAAGGNDRHAFRRHPAN